MRWSVLQCVGVCCSVLWCVDAAPQKMLPAALLTPHMCICMYIFLCCLVCCNALECVAVRCSVLQCVAVCCGV